MVGGGRFAGQARQVNVLQVDARQKDVPQKDDAIMIMTVFVWCRVACIAVTIAGTAAGIAHAAEAPYPVKPLRLLTTGVGGAGDLTARLIAQGLTAGLGQQVIVDNRPSGFTPGEVVSRAAPDGYTLLVLGTTHWTGPLLQTVPFDPVRDFSPISLAVSAPNIIVVHPSLPARQVKELIDLARASPGVLNYGTSGTGSSNHLAAELFNYMAGVKITRVAYKSNSVAMTDLMSGQLQVAFPTAGAAAPYVKQGRLRALAVTSVRPSPLYPGVPAAAQAGLPGYESTSPIGVFAPAKTPVSVIDRLQKEIAHQLTTPAIRERFAAMGAETVGSTPQQLHAFMTGEIARLGKMIKAAGIRAQ